MNTADIMLIDESEKVLERALELVQNNRYKPADAFYVTEDGRDTGESENYCGKCIDYGVRSAQRYRNTKRKEIIAIYKTILDRGFYMQGRKKINVGKFRVLRVLVSKLQDYPKNVEFGYLPYDPNFSGYLTSPESCNKCGRYFDTTFAPDEQEAQYLLELVNAGSRLTEGNKWELATALENFDNVREDSDKETLVKVAEKLLEREAFPLKKSRNLKSHLN
jgi:hypothetical protein